MIGIKLFMIDIFIRNLQYLSLLPHRSSKGVQINVRRQVAPDGEQAAEKSDNTAKSRTYGHPSAFPVQLHHSRINTLL